MKFAKFNIAPGEGAYDHEEVLIPIDDVARVSDRGRTRSCVITLRSGEEVKVEASIETVQERLNDSCDCSATL